MRPFSGQYHSVFKGRGMNFEEVRGITVPETTFGRIRLERHRRMNTPYVKKFTEERELTVMLLVDVERLRARSGSVEAEQARACRGGRGDPCFQRDQQQRQGRTCSCSSANDVELFIRPEKAVSTPCA